jgi:hypothetical protein
MNWRLWRPLTMIPAVGMGLWNHRLHRQKSRATCNTSESTEGERTLSTSVAQVPIACALERTKFAERIIIIDQITRAAIERKNIPDGLAFCFESNPGLMTQLANFAELERACCPFLSFKITAKADGRIWLEITGPATAHEILRELIPTSGRS